jgi:erythromycin esterase
MKAKLIMLLFLVSLLSCKKENLEPENDLTSDEKQLVIELNQVVTELNGSSPILDNSDIEVLSLFGDATVIAFGEATHGTADFFQMKHRLFKYFVENHGFKIFGFEADMGECIYIDRFITKGIGTIDEVMGKMHFWVWKTKEVEKLILWMKEYNSGKSETDWIHFLGVDCQYATYNKELIEEYLNIFDSTYPSYINQILSEITTINTTRKLPDNRSLNDMKIRCDSILDYFINREQILISSSGKFEYSLMVGLIKQTKQFLQVLVNTSYRDFYMAENSVWLTSLLENPTKVALWAHNSHIAKNPSYVSASQGSQGYYISQSLAENYRAIGFSFNTGSFRAFGYDTQTGQYTGISIQYVSQLPLRESYNYMFHWVEPKDFIIINSNIPTSSDLYNWYNTEMSFQSAGAVYSSQIWDKYYQKTNLMTYYDAIIHFQNTRSSIAYY